MQFTSILAALAMPILAANAATTTSSTSLYEAPRPSGVGGASFGFTTGSAYGGFAGATSGAAGGMIGGTIVPTQSAASGAATGAYGSAHGIASGSIAPTAGIGKLQGADGGNGGELEATFGPAGPGGCGGGMVNGQGTTLCVRRREPAPTAL